MSFLTGIDAFVRTNEPLALHTWLRVGGPAEYFAEPHTTEQLATVLSRCRQEGMTVRLLGGGSNLLVSDAGVKGMVIRLADPHFAEIKVQGDRVVAGGGARLGHVVNTSVREGLAGLEALVGIPGTIGGALHGNAGGRGGDIGQWTHSAKVMTYSGEIIERSRDELVFAYRQSSLDELVIL
ncbi:MAG: FAD-binding protein, partial [Planctomycetaceae bacterium]|nr:FAD-binding protein [Planctomycetaceae bacterium]